MSQNSLKERGYYTSLVDYYENPSLIECALSKMARTFLRYIRVCSKGELKERILQGIAELNADPVPFRWKKFDLELV